MQRPWLAEYSVSAESLRFAPGVRLRVESDAVAFLLVPEGVVELNPTAAAIAALIDGTRTPDALARDLAQRYDAPVEALRADVDEFCNALRERGHLIAG
jgi:coenzyme PQQ biosynthesis protein PqqD